MPCPRNCASPGGGRIISSQDVGIAWNQQTKKKQGMSESGKERVSRLDLTSCRLKSATAGYADIDKVNLLAEDLLEKRKSRLDGGTRSFQSAPSLPVRNYETIDLLWDEQEARSVKRRREDNPDGEGDKRQGTELLASRARRTIEDIERTTRTLHELTKERNTKRELKEVSQKLCSLASSLTTREIQELLQKLGKPQQKGALEDLEKYRNEKEDEIRALKTENEDLKKSCEN